jgi:hypothetical protein
MFLGVEAVDLCNSVLAKGEILNCRQLTLMLGYLFVIHHVCCSVSNRGRLQTEYEEWCLLGCYAVWLL